MDTNIFDPNARIVFFPVRHHSPACARLVRQLAHTMQPSIILIEGPSDFNDRLHELTLPHQLPIAIYSYVQLADARRGAFYPFCIYSPEWQALQIAQKLSIPAQFIDLPWAEMAVEELPSHRYADAELKRSDYVASLCQKLGVEDFNALWDNLFEIDSTLTVAQYLERCHQFCFHIRSTEVIPSIDLGREAFMVNKIRHAMHEYPGKILVVTGGFHSYALYEQCRVESESRAQHPTAHIVERGIALTPYTYQRLDSLTGYDSGMPSPGFYHIVWHHRSKGQPAAYRSLLAQVVQDMRQRQQVVSSADLIAVETMARALATLRGHAEVWRQDLIDGIIGSLVKEELAYGCTHPFLQAVYKTLQGNERGRLAPGTTLPLLVQDIQQLLLDYELEPTAQKRTIELHLTTCLLRSHTKSGIDAPFINR